MAQQQQQHGADSGSELSESETLELSFEVDEGYDYTTSFEREIQPYMYEPETEDIPENEMFVEVVEENDGTAGGGRLTCEVTDWCECGHCTTMSTENECLCCKEIHKVINKCLEVKEDPIPKCITLHPGFRSVALCEWNLQAVYFIYRQHYGPMTGIDQHEQFRYTAYRHFVRWIWGWCGKDCRVILPSCAVNAIRKKFPDPSNNYTGFRLPCLDHL